ncbi:MAG: hypothetical protein ACR2PG_18595 [Hyphomicrobiaceae bacterium]
MTGLNGFTAGLAVGRLLPAVLMALSAATIACMTYSPVWGQKLPDTSTTLFPAITTPSVGQPDAQRRRRSVGANGELRLSAVITDTGPSIDRGLVWRIFRITGRSSAPVLVSTVDAARPVLSLAPGSYVVNVAYGLAHLTRSIPVTPDQTREEQFVINAGGLRMRVRLDDGNFASPRQVTFDLLSDDRDQYGNRKRILSNKKPGGITRLNSGIYHIVSRLGDANAVVTSEVAVEAGKLTEATVVHEAAKVTFKLTRAAGGDALADAQWVIMSMEGQVVRETAGALPSHVLAPGEYTISARWGGKLHTRSFAVTSGDNVEVEVVIQ